MPRLRLVSVVVLVLTVVAVTLVAPSVEHPTRTHGGDTFTGSNDTSTMEYGNPGDSRSGIADSRSSDGNNSSQSGGSQPRSDGGAIDGRRSLAAVAGTLLVVLVVGSVFVFTRLSGERIDPDRFATSSEEVSKTAETASEPDLAAVGSAAGRAAEQIENDPENAVYRAWHEMTTLLDLSDPETATPGEFADGAIDAGMDPDDVALLTDLFETVRYGDAPVTADRGRQAREALRRIESRYGDDEP